jgi:LysM repeat protein
MHTTALPAASAPTHLRITRRGRAVLTTLAAIPIVAGAIFLAVNGASLTGTDVAYASGSAAAVEFDYVTVQAGQSLWMLAEDLAPSADPRDVMADLVNLNQLVTEEVQPGQRLAIPEKY